MHLIVKNGRAEMHNDVTGAMERRFNTFGNVDDGDYDPGRELVLLVLSNGKVELRDNKTGTVQRTFLQGPYNKATFSDGGILLRKANGRHELRSLVTGDVVRSF